MLTNNYSMWRQTSNSRNLLVEEPNLSHRKYSSTSSVNFSHLKNSDFNLLRDYINNNCLLPRNSQLIKFMLTELLQKNCDLLQISEKTCISQLTLKKILSGKNKALISRKSFLKILDFYIIHINSHITRS